MIESAGRGRKPPVAAPGQNRKSPVTRADRGLTPPARLFLLALAVALVAHGCHSGDHDFEPSATPPRVVE
jgi:hypothetical protein